MDEFDFIKQIQQPTYKQSSLIKGIGDDAAVFRQNYHDIVTSVDTLVENVHFSNTTMKPFHIGYRALAANLSDMAAMGCSPTFYMVSIVIPDYWDENLLKEIYEGMNYIAKDYNIDLIGGDTTSGNQLVISVTIIGFVEKNKARYRGNARDGDLVFVTGTLGDAAAGFHILTNADNKDENSYLINRHRMPTPRVTFANQLSHLTRLTLNDISDGIANEATEIAETSNLTVFLTYDKIPYHPDLEEFSPDQQRKWKLFGGEDFELIGTVSESDWPTVKAVAERTNTKVTKIGYVKDHKNSNNKVFLQEENGVAKLNKLGYTHLK